MAERAAALGPGQYVWEAKSASTGPVFLTIDRSKILIIKGETQCTEEP